MTSIKPLVLPKQLSSEESGSKSGCDGDDFSRLGLQDGARDSTNNEYMNFVQSMDVELDHVCADSASLSGLTKIC